MTVYIHKIMEWKATARAEEAAKVCLGRGAFWNGDDLGKLITVGMVLGEAFEQSDCESLLNLTFGECFEKTDGEEIKIHCER